MPKIVGMLQRNHSDTGNMGPPGPFPSSCTHTPSPQGTMLTHTVSVPGMSPQDHPTISTTTSASLPVSSERDNSHVLAYSPNHGTRFWVEDHLGDDPIDTEGRSGNECGSDGWSEDELMEEHECKNVGSRRHHHGPRSEDMDGESKAFQS